MFCRKCGKEIFDEAVICPSCGCETGVKSEIKQEKVDVSILGIFALIFSILGGIVGFVLSLIGFNSPNLNERKFCRIGLAISIAWISLIVISWWLSLLY